jgi:DNA polymerase V
VFALIDGNCFYASCERIFNPQLRHKPVIVLSNNDGCVVTRSPEAKALGIGMGVPFFTIKDVVAANGVAVFSSNYELYGDISSRMMQAIASQVPSVEVYSIDECFAKLDDMPAAQLYPLGCAIRAIVLQWVGIPTCVGIAPTKTLAKYCNHLAKKHPSLNGVVNWHNWTTQQQARSLASQPVDAIWGVGSNIARRLQQLGIHTALDFCQAPPPFIRKHLGLTIARTHSEMRGVSCIDISPASHKQQLIRSRSFGKKIVALSDLQAAIAHHASSAALALRSQQVVAAQVSVSLQTLIAATPVAPYQRSYKQLSTTLSSATSSTLRINQAAQALLGQLYQAGQTYHKCGIMLSGIEPVATQQLDLFASQDSVQSTQLMHCIDRINQQYGQGRITLASEQQSQQWRMQRSHISPCYTTQFGQLLRVN